MKQLLLSSAIVLGIACQAFGQDIGPFSITHYGLFKKIDGVVNLKEAISLPHVYAVGATAKRTGEITVMDSELWLDYGADGLGNAKRAVADEEEAALLVRAQVEEWRTVKIPVDMGSGELYEFILNNAEIQGLDREQPFPFLLAGDFFDLDWHVLNGLKPKPDDHGKGGIFNKIKEHRPQTCGSVIGFYAAANQGVFTHPGESWHLHIVFEKEAKAGHLDAISVRQGTLLKLPVSRLR